MRRRTAVLASAILAIGGFGIADPLLSVSFGQQQQQQNTGQSTGQTGRTTGQGIGGQSTNTNRNATGEREGEGATANHAGQQAELKGVQSLFAEATDAAVMRDGLQRMEALIAPEHMGAGATGTSGVNHGTYTPGAGSTSSGTSGAGNAGRTPGTSGGTSSGSGLSGSSGVGGTSSGTASHTGTGTNGATGNAGIASSRTGQANADTQKLNQLIDQFNRDWKQKYSRDFRISDPALVFADITANDIMAGQAQPAGERLPGNGANGTSGSTSGTSGASGTSGSTSGTSGTRGRTSGTTGGTSSGTSGSSGAPGAAGSSGQSSPGAGSASDRTSGTSHAGATGTGATGASANMMGREVTVNVPPVQGSQAVTVRLVRMGQDNFRFASSNGGMVDQQRLASALETHLKHVIDQKDRWPTDAAQAQRLVTQHVLMAVSEVCNGTGDNAQPAGAHLPGQNGTNGNTTPGSSGGNSGTGNTGNTSGTGSGSGTSGSRTGTSGTGR